MKNIFSILILFSLLIASCDKPENNPRGSGGGGGTGNQGPLNEPGYGKSKENFKGPYWQLPPGITLKDGIHAYEYCWFGQRKPIDDKHIKGVPGGYDLCFTLSNNTGQPLRLVFPHTLIFISVSTKSQNHLVIGLAPIEVPAGETMFRVSGFCVNLDRNVPSMYIRNTNEILTYQFGPYDVPPALKEVVDIVSAKNLTIDDVLKTDGTIDSEKFLKLSPIVNAIHEVCDKQGLTAKTKKELQEITL